MGEWIRLNEKFPNKYETVILSLYGGRIRIGWWGKDALYGRRIWYTIEGEELCENPTHWMPLPDPPIG